MERWEGKVAVVTGASSGIGAAVAKELAQKGLKVVGLARRVENIEVIASELKDAPGKLYGVKADATKEEDLLAAFKWVKDNLGGVDVLVNNAGVYFPGGLSDGSASEWKLMLETNVLALSICTKEAIKSMKERGVNDGHIIHINSVLGHELPQQPSANMYSTTKHAVTALTDGLRKELRTLKSQIRITSISPGAVYTEMITKNVPAAMINTIPMLKAENIAGAVIYALSQPPAVQVYEISMEPIQ